MKKTVKRAPVKGKGSTALVKKSGLPIVSEVEGNALMTVNPEALIARAIDKGVPLEQMERLLAMRRELKAEWARERYFSALSAFQSQCPVIKKTKEVWVKGQLRYKFAPIEDIVSQVGTLLEKHGFSYNWTPEQPDGKVKTTCHAHHVDGHTESVPFEVAVATDAFMNAAQHTASAFTYTKRYSFLAAFGIATGDEDDDAQNAGNGEEPTLKPRKDTPVYDVPTPKANPKESALADLRDVYAKMRSSGLFTAAELEERVKTIKSSENDLQSLIDLQAHFVDEMNARKRAEA